MPTGLPIRRSVRSVVIGHNVRGIIHGGRRILGPARVIVRGRTIRAPLCRVRAIVRCDRFIQRAEQHVLFGRIILRTGNRVIHRHPIVVVCV